MTVNETSTYQRPDEDKVPLQPYNEKAALSIEATAINQNFQQQVVNAASSQSSTSCHSRASTNCNSRASTNCHPSQDAPKGKKKFENPNPFFDEEEDEGKPASIAYRYRKWDLGSNLHLVARTELHGKVKKKDGTKKMTVYALNEWDSKLGGGIEWRTKIDQSRGAVLATESVPTALATRARWRSLLWRSPLWPVHGLAVTVA